MSNEKLKFMDMLSVMRVIDDDDRVRKFEDCIEKVFSEVSKKVAEYGRDGSLTIQIKFQCDKKNKNAVNVFAEVKKTIPKGCQANSFYRDSRTGGMYLDDPDQLRLFDTEKTKVREITGKEAAAQND